MSKYMDRLSIIQRDKRLTPIERACLQMLASVEDSKMDYDTFYKRILNEKSIIKDKNA